MTPPHHDHHHHDHRHQPEVAEADAATFWDHRYAERDQIWSGRVNSRLTEFVEALTPGTALDLGCGEGADAVWLAERGWVVTAVDVSTVALDRASGLASARGVADRIDFQAHDLTRSFPDGEFDLVSAQFFHSPVELPRHVILRRAADAVAPGGRLLIVEHADAPPWSEHLHEGLPTLDETHASLELGTHWQPEYLGTPTREATAPDGQTVSLRDNVLLLRRDA